MGGPLSIIPCSISGSFQASQAEEGCPEPQKSLAHSMLASARQSLGKQRAPADPA